MEMDCIPCGMELFPAMDEEQFEFIKRVIDDCDYYLLIIGGRYGSTTSDGLSFTEKEYDYAIAKGLKVIALLHGNPEIIPAGKSESDPGLRERLAAFRAKVSQGRLVRTWSRAEELPALVALNLSKTIKTFPAIGWVRGNQVSNVESLSELNELRKEREKLLNLLDDYQNGDFPKADNLASFDETINIEFVYSKKNSTTNKMEKYTWDSTFTWKEIFAGFSPLIYDPVREREVQDLISGALASCRGKEIGKINQQTLLTLKVQFQALDLITILYPENPQPWDRCYWQLTPNGKQLMVDLRTIKSTKPMTATMRKRSNKLDRS